MQIFLTGKKPIFEEIVDSLHLYIKSGLLKPGERLPSVRDLAISLAINPNTVMRAYQVLTDEGLLVTIPKKGLYVAGSSEEKATDNKLISALKAIIDEGYCVSEIQEALATLKEESDD